MSADLPDASGPPRPQHAAGGPGAVAAPGLLWVNQDVLRNSRSRVLRRAELEQLLSAERLQRDLQAQADAARQGLQAWRQAAEQAGHAAGHAAGLAAGRAEWARQLAQGQWQRHRQLQDLQPALVAVVMQALRHLVQALPDTQRFELLAAQLVAQAVQARRLRLVVAPADAAAAEALLQRWPAHAAGCATEVMVDDALSPGDCVLETDETAIDGRLDERLAQVQAALQASLQAATGPSSPAPSPAPSPTSTPTSTPAPSPAAWGDPTA